MEVHTSLSAIVYQTVKLQLQEDNINVALNTNCLKPSYIHLGRSLGVFVQLKCQRIHSARILHYLAETILHIHFSIT